MKKNTIYQLIIYLIIFQSCVTQQPRNSFSTSNEYIEKPTSIIGKWLVEKGSNEICISYFPDYTYTIELNQEVIEVGFFSYDSIYVTINPIFVYNRDTGLLQRTPTDQKIDIEYDISNNELTQFGYDIFKYQGQIDYNTSNALTSNIDSIGIKARIDVLKLIEENELNKKNYFEYKGFGKNQLFYKDKLPSNIQQIEELNIDHTAFQNNNPYGFSENTAYIPFIPGKVIQWIGDSCLYDFAGVASSQLYWECLGLIMFEGQSKSMLSDQNTNVLFEYIGVFNYRTVNNIPKTIPKFRIIYYAP